MDLPLSSPTPGRFSWRGINSVGTTEEGGSASLLNLGGLAAAAASAHPACPSRPFAPQQVFLFLQPPSRFCCQLLPLPTPTQRATMPSNPPPPSSLAGSLSPSLSRPSSICLSGCEVCGKRAAFTCTCTNFAVIHYCGKGCQVIQLAAAQDPLQVVADLQGEQEAAAGRREESRGTRACARGGGPRRDSAHRAGWIGFLLSCKARRQDQGSRDALSSARCRCPITAPKTLSAVNHAPGRAASASGAGLISPSFSFAVLSKERR